MAVNQTQDERDIEARLTALRVDGVHFARNPANERPFLVLKEKQMLDPVSASAGAGAGTPPAPDAIAALSQKVDTLAGTVETFIKAQKEAREQELAAQKEKVGGKPQPHCVGFRRDEEGHVLVAKTEGSYRKEALDSMAALAAPVLQYSEEVEIRFTPGAHKAITGGGEATVAVQKDLGEIKTTLTGINDTLTKLGARVEAVEAVRHVSKQTDPPGNAGGAKPPAGDGGDKKVDFTAAVPPWVTGRKTE